MNPRHQPPAFPEATDGDNDDVAWALHTGGVEWRRGAHAEALQWLRRAIDSARANRALNRARDLEFRGRTLQVALEVGWVSKPPSAPIPEAPVVKPRAPGPPPAPSARKAQPAPISPARLSEATELGAEELVDFDDGEHDTDLSSEEHDVVFDEDPPSESEPEQSEPEDDDDEYADVRASEVELDDEVALIDESDIVLLPEPAKGSSAYPTALDSVVPMAPNLPSALLDNAASPFPSAEQRPPSHPQPRDALPPPPESDLEHLIDEPLLEYRESEPRAPQPTLVDDTPQSFPSVEPPTKDAAQEYFEPSSLVPAEPLDEEPTDRDLDPALERGLEPPSRQAPLSTSGLFPSVPLVDGPNAISADTLENVAGLQDLPEDAQELLIERARLKDLAAEEEIRGFGLALVVEGSVAVMPTIADIAVAQVPRGHPIVGRGNLVDGVPLRVVAGAHGARVLHWSPRDLEDSVRECPWVVDELRGVGDRFQAFAGAALGPLGESLDDVLRGMVVERCEVLLFLENELVAEKGKPLSGMFVIGGGHLEIVPGDAADEPATELLGAGEFLFPAQILQAGPAPAHARAGKGGVVGLFAPRPVAHELMLSVPPLLEIFAR